MSAAKDGPRDWDKELAEIDKLIEADAAGGGGAAQAPVRPAPPERPVPPPGARAALAAAPADRRAALYTWLRLLLGLTLGAAITQWPYTHGCGLALFAYLGAVGGVGAAALWSAVSSWRSRSAMAHALSVGLLFWGATLAAREILPRAGYAKHAASWTCSAPAPPARLAEPPAPGATSAPAEPSAPAAPTTPPGTDTAGANP